MSLVPERVYKLKSVPTDELIEELTKRGVTLADLPWQDCGECNHIKRLSESGRTCGARKRPTWFPDGPDGSGNPEKVGFYSIACTMRTPYISELDGKSTQP
jgi:hypothetical protein